MTAIIGDGTAVMNLHRRIPRSPARLMASEATAHPNALHIRKSLGGDPQQIPASVTTFRIST